jgi:predicted TIM-barrel fold metal-dependent hydrolase
MKRKITLSICVLLLLSSINSMAQVKNGNNKSPLPIIDVHLHAFTITPGAPNENIKVYAPKSQEEYEKQILASLKKYNVYGITSGEDSVIERLKVKEPKRIIPSKLIWSPKDVNIDELRQQIKDGKWKAIGEMLTQCEGLAANDPSIDPIYSLAEEMDIPVGIHMGPGPAGAAYIPMFRGFRVSLTHPFYLEDVLIKHPKLRLYVMHAGYPMIDEMIAMMDAFPQLYVGIAAIDWLFGKEEFYNYLKRLVGAGFGKRIMYGSDEMNWPEGIELSIKNVQNVPFLTQSQKRDIFYNNAVRFFKLNKEDVGGN